MEHLSGRAEIVSKGEEGGGVIRVMERPKVTTVTHCEKVTTVTHFERMSGGTCDVET